MMTGFAALNATDSRDLLDKYLHVSCLSLEVLRAKIKPFASQPHVMKNHPGQIEVAARISKIVSGSNLVVDDEQLSSILSEQRQLNPSSGSQTIEDSYTLRCTPQILGPLLDGLDFVTTTVERELNSTSDNPVISPDTGEIFHGGHFHGQYISCVMDYLSIALTTLSNLSDRRIDRLLSPHYNEGLPPFLCRETPGIRLGLMGGQFMATSMAAENRSLCHPMAIQSLPSTGGFRDHVSMGLVAARKCRQILDNTTYVVAFELLCG